MRYLEYFAPLVESDAEQDYTMMDAAVRAEYQAPQKELPAGDVLLGKDVVVMADGYFFEGVKMAADARIPEAAKNIMVGLPYTMTLEQPNWDAGNTDTGTVQGRKKVVTNAILRLTKSYGGRVGQNAHNMDKIIYDAEAMETDNNVLYTGDKKITLPAGGYDTDGRTCIVHDTPYPFSLSAVIREVSFGG